VEHRADAVSGPDLSGLVRWGWSVAREAAWAPAFVIAAHMTAIFAFDGYRRFAWLDLAMHFAGGVAVGYLFDRASRIGSRLGVLGPFHPMSHFLLAGSLVCVAAVVWEFAEFALDEVYGTRFQPGLRDTMVDLLLGNLGGAIYLAVCVLLRARSRHRGDDV